VELLLEGDDDNNNKVDTKNEGKFITSQINRIKLCKKLCF